jgi:hypothetical protein
MPDPGPSRRKASLLQIGLVAAGSHFWFYAIAQAACEPPAPGPAICLTGTILAPGVKIAMIEQAGHTGVSELRLGDSIDDWRVIEIGPKFVKLGRADETATVGIADPNPPQPATPAPVRPVLRRRGD